MSGKARVATVWLDGCSGCHMSFLDMDEFLIELAGKVQLVYSPVIDVKEYPEGVDLAFIEGAVCNVDHVEMLHKVRARTKLVIAFGDCAVTGNVPALRNPLGKAESVLQRAYIDGVDLSPGIPSLKGIVPALLDRVAPLHELVRVDLYLPGCPPPAPRIRSLVDQLLAGQAPALEGVNLKFG
jgi:NAD-reducing hydrogenase small subunit